jgi:hypothetical protein
MEEKEPIDEPVTQIIHRRTFLDYDEDLKL